MIKSMTGFSKGEASESGNRAVVEIKSLNGRYFELNCKLPRGFQHLEGEIRELARKGVSRGTLTINAQIEQEPGAQGFKIDENAAKNCFDALDGLKKSLKMKSAIGLEDVLHFSDFFVSKEESTQDEILAKLLVAATAQALKSLDSMRTQEGGQISKDILSRMKRLENMTQKIETLSIERVPQERERLRARIAQLFESDEIDEQRLQMEIVFQADKLDISEECVRLRSHEKFFYDTFKGNEPPGRKLVFLLQEMHREINTIGSKINDAQISQIVVNFKEELERIREQIQNIE
ncbi:MAG: YicC/YloC family endoribonuclease [Chloroflexota bacterium]